MQASGLVAESRKAGRKRSIWQLLPVLPSLCCTQFSCCAHLVEVAALDSQGTPASTKSTCSKMTPPLLGSLRFRTVPARSSCTEATREGTWQGSTCQYGDIRRTAARLASYSPTSYQGGCGFLRGRMGEEAAGPGMRR